MRKIYFLLLTVLYATIANAQLTGTKNIPGAYATLALAITDLNVQGVGAGGVTFNLLAGNPQTAPSGGYVIGGVGSLVLTTSSAANPITFTGNANVITASAAQAVGALNDAVFKLIGADWVTFQGFNIQENVANVNNVAATNTMTEWGIALLHVSTTDGCQNNTIQNNTISLNRTYNNTFGIYSNTCHSASTLGVIEDITALSGANAPNKVYGNQISNINFGIIFIGSNTPAFMDNANDIGGVAAGTGNTLSNWGGLAATAATYINLTGNIAGIGMWHEYGYNVSWNSVTSAAVTITAATHFGIISNYPVAVPSGSFTNTISNNTVTVAVSNTASTGGITAINNTSTVTTVVPGAIVNITNNTVTAQLSGTGTTPSVQGITNGFNAGTVNINNNLLLNCSTTITGAGSLLCIFTAFSSAVLAPGTVNIQSNTVRGCTVAGAAATAYMIDQESAVSAAANILNNNVGDATAGALTFTTATSGFIVGIRNINAANAATLTITGNTIRGFSLLNTTGSFNAIFNVLNTIAAGTVNISNNNMGVAAAGGGLVNFSAAQTIGIIGINNTIGVAAGTLNMNGNSIRGINFALTPNAVTGIAQTFNWTTGTININNNNIGTGDNGSTGAFATFNAAQASTVTGILNSAGTGSVLSINNNNFQGVNFVVAGTGALQCINNTATAATQTINNNNFNNLTINTSNSTLGFLIAASNATPVVTITGNFTTTQFSNITSTGGANYLAIANATATHPATGTTTISGNNLSNMSFKTTTSFGAVVYWSSGNIAGCTHNVTVTGNTLNNIANTSVGTATQAANLYGVLVSYGNTNVISNNDISLSAAGGTVIGVFSATASTNAAGNVSIRNNNIHDLVTTSVFSGTAAGTAQGIQLQGGPATTTPNTIYQNKIINISATNGEAFGIYQAQSTAASTTNIYNNFIGRLFATTSVYFQGVAGIFHGGSTANTTNLYYNTIKIDGSCPGQSYCVYTNSVTPTINMIDNILVNKVTPTGGAGFPSVVYYRTGSLTATYATTSNNNDMYCGTPGPLNLIYADGVVNAITNPQQTLAAFQAFSTPREVNSITADPVFISTTDLHLSNAAGANWCLNAAGQTIATYTTDYDLDIRGTPPDIGADEFVAVGSDIATPASQTVCSGTAITTIVLSGGAGSYNWTRNNTVSATGIAASGTGNISGTLTNTTSAPVIVTFTITPLSLEGCASPSGTFTSTVTLNPAPNAVATPSSQTICSAATITTIVLSGNVAGTVFNWTRDNTVAVTGIAASGSGNISGSLTNTTNAPVTVTFTITPTANGCPGTPITATVLVNPTPNAVATPASQTICSAGAITTIVLSGNVAGTVFNWTRDNNVTVTGIAASGSGNISGSLTNTTNAPVTVTFTITPTANGCPGAAITATVLVNPTPNAVATPSSQTICSAGTITTIVLSGNVAGTVFNWTRDNTVAVTGIAASGSGNISGALTNTTGAPVTVTFTITPTANGCPGTPITATVLVNPLPVLSAVVTQPTTCVSTDGAIDLTVSGTPGPYTYFWTTIGGSGIVQGVQDQFTLTVGQYTVLVTDQITGCQQTAVFNLTGPGGCSICPTIASVTTNPTPGACAGSTVTLTASGLTFMGITYGITFKYSLVALPDPYVGGTVIGTVANGSLGGGGTTATLNTSFPVGGNYIIYAILTPTPIDPFCRPSAQVNLTVNANPVVNPVTSQTYCNGTVVPTGTFNFSSPTTAFGGKILIAYSDGGVPPTQLRNNLLALPGVTQVDLFDANAGTPSLAQMQQYSIVVPFSNSPYADPVAMGNNLADYVDANGIVVGLGFTFYTSPYGPTGRWVTGNYSPYTASANLDFNPHTLGSFTAGHPLMTGVTVLTSNYHNIVPVAAGATEVAQWDNGQSLIAFKGRVVGITAYIGSSATWSGDFAKVIVNAGTWLGGGTLVFNWTNNNITIGLGASGTGTSLPTFTATNAGTVPVTATVSVTASLTNAGITCTGPATTFTITVKPTPNTVATPSSQTICSASAITTIVLTGNVAGTVFNWTRDNTVAVTGIAASGSGNISGTLTNTTFAPVTVTFTITPTANGCTGPSTTATVLVNPTPNAVATPASQTVCSALPITTIVLSGSVAGTTFNWTRNNTATATGIAASGSGNISGTLTNITNAPVTVTFTITPTANGCAGAAITATVLVNPTPNASAAPPSQTICSGSAITPIVLSSTTTGGDAFVNGGFETGTLPPWVILGSNPAPVVNSTAPHTGTKAAFLGNLPGPEPLGDASFYQQITVPASGGILSYWYQPFTTDGIAFDWQDAYITNTSGTILTTLMHVCTTNAYTQVTFNMAPYAGQTVRVEFLVHQDGFGDVTNMYVDDVTLLTPAVITYNWTRDNNATVTGIAASGSGTPITGTLTNTTFAPVTVTFTITPTSNGCIGTPTTATVLVNPTPNAIATPSSQTICSGTAITPIVLTSSVTGTTYAWTRNNTATVTGIAASGTGNISGSLTNTTTAPVTVTFTITPTANGCAGPPITATVIVQAPLLITCPGNITVPSIVGGCTAIVTYAPVVTGTPAPTFTYTLSGATTGAGNGTGSGLAYNVGVTTVTITATNSCSTVSCSFTITVTDSQLPVVTTPPANTTVCVGSGATFSVVATNTLSYQWQAWNGSTWNNIAGATASTLTLNGVTFSMNTNSYRVIVTGLCSSVTSSFATLFVNQLPTVSILASRPPVLLPTQTLTLTAVVSPGGGTYQWFKNGVAIVGATGSTLSGLTVDDVGTYTVRYTDVNGCVQTSAGMAVSSATSGNIYLYPNPNTGHFQVRFNNAPNEKVTVNIYDAKGSLVYRQAAVTTTAYTSIQIDISNLPSETYVVTVIGEDGRLIGARRVVVGR